jgi:hypothetical protein
MTTASQIALAAHERIAESQREKAEREAEEERKKEEARALRQTREARKAATKSKVTEWFPDQEWNLLEWRPTNVYENYLGGDPIPTIAIITDATVDSWGPGITLAIPKNSPKIYWVHHKDGREGKWWWATEVTSIEEIGRHLASARAVWNIKVDEINRGD